MAIAYNSNYDHTMPFSDVCFQITCSPGLVENITIPGPSTTKYKATIKFEQLSNVFVGLNHVPVIPVSGSPTTTPYVELHDLERFVSGGDVLHFLTNELIFAGGYGSVSLRQLP